MEEDPVPLRVPVWLLVGSWLALWDPLGVWVCVRVGLCVTLEETVALEVAVSDVVNVGLLLGVLDTVSDCVRVIESEAVMDCVWEGEIELLRVSVGVTDGMHAMCRPYSRTLP